MYARLKSFGAYEYSVFYVLRFTLHSFRKGSDAQIQKPPSLFDRGKGIYKRESIFTTLQTKFQRNVAGWQTGMLITCLVIHGTGNLSFPATLQPLTEHHITLIDGGAR